MEQQQLNNFHHHGHFHGFHFLHLCLPALYPGQDSNGSGSHPRNAGTDVGIYPGTDAHPFLHSFTLRGNLELQKSVRCCYHLHYSSLSIHYYYQVQSPPPKKKQPIMLQRNQREQTKAKSSILKTFPWRKTY